VIGVATKRIVIRPGEKKTVKVPGPIRRITITTKPGR